MATKPTIKKLKNGMTAIFVPQKGAVSATVLVLSKVGSRYESKNINGASHFIEHLMFKGTKRRPTAQTLSRELDRIGADYNAYTDKDVTGYYIKMDAAKTELAVDMLHDMLFHSKFDAKEMDRERGVIIEEINMYEDNPRAHVDDLLEAELFPNSTLGWDIAGPREVIRSVSRDDLVSYRDAYYIPERMAVIVAGKVLSGTLALLEKTFGSVKRKAGDDRPFDPFCQPATLKGSVAYQDKTTEQVQLAMGFYGFPTGHADAPAAGLLANVLGGNMSSRLFTQIRERRGLCYSINASHGTREDVGAFSIMAGLDKKRVPEAVKAIFAELKKLVRTSPTVHELNDAKENVRGRTMLAFEDSATQAEWYGKQWLFKKTLETPEERMKKFDAVTPSDIRRVAKKIFHPEKTALALIGPFGDKKNILKFAKWS